MNPETNFDSSQDPDRLEREIDAQRRDINDTLRALEGKFTSQEIANQLMNYFGGHGREWAANLGNSMKANPVPALLTAVGVTWLMMSDRNGGTYRQQYAYAPNAYEGERSAMYEGGASAARNAAGAVKQKVGELGDKAAHAGEALHEKAAHAGEALHEKAAHARDALRSRASRAREGLGRSRAGVRNNFAHMAHEQPLALGAVGIALGALIGAALPRTAQETRVMGKASGRLMQQGKAMAREGYEMASKKAVEVAEVAKETLQRTVEETKRQADSNNA